MRVRPLDDSPRRLDRNPAKEHSDPTTVSWCPALAALHGSAAEQGGCRERTSPQGWTHERSACGPHVHVLRDRDRVGRLLLALAHAAGRELGPIARGDVAPSDKRTTSDYRASLGRWRRDRCFRLWIRRRKRTELRNARPTHYRTGAGVSSSGPQYCLVTGRVHGSALSRTHGERRSHLQVRRLMTAVQGQDVLR